MFSHLPKGKKLSVQTTELPDASVKKGDISTSTTTSTTSSGSSTDTPITPESPALSTTPSLNPRRLTARRSPSSYDSLMQMISGDVVSNPTPPGGPSGSSGQSFQASSRLLMMTSEVSTPTPPGGPSSSSGTLPRSMSIQGLFSSNSSSQSSMTSTPIGLGGASHPTIASSIPKQEASTKEIKVEVKKVLLERSFSSSTDRFAPKVYTLLKCDSESAQPLSVIDLNYLGAPEVCILSSSDGIKFPYEVKKTITGDYHQKKLTGILEKHRFSADLSEAMMSEITASQCDFSYCNLYKADGSGSRFEHSHFNYTQAVEMKLNGAFLEGAVMYKVNLFRAELKRTQFTYAYMLDADLRQVKAEGANFSRVKAAGTSFDNAELCGSDFTKANLRKSSFINTDLRDANLVGADLTDSYLIGADLRGANLTGANLTGTDLNDIRVDDKTNFTDTIIDGRLYISSSLLSSSAKGLDPIREHLAKKSLVNVPSSREDEQSSTLTTPATAVRRL